jgi:hypothetical protein
MGMSRSRDWCLIGTLSIGAAGCAPHVPTRVAVFPSLRPVDAACPIVVFSQVQGKACGNDAVLGALREMKRLNGVDGYIEVVVIETGSGERRCAQATAYPFRYGTDTSTPVVRAGEEGTQPVSYRGSAAVCGPAPSAATTQFDCTDACQRFAALVETGSIKTALAKDRCEQRCKQPDVAFQKCIDRAHETAAAKACLTP